jgi:hypothetical protein
MTPLILKRASVSRSSGDWRDDDYDVLENGVVVGRIFCLDTVGPQGRPWMWASGHSAATVKRAAHSRSCDGCVRKELARNLGVTACRYRGTRRSANPRT